MAKQRLPAYREKSVADICLACPHEECVAAHHGCDAYKAAVKEAKKGTKYAWRWKNAGKKAQVKASKAHVHA